MHRDSLDLACWQIIMLFVTSPSKLLRFVSTDFVALRLFSFNIRQHDRQILYFKLHVDGRKFHCRRPHATVRPQVVHRWPRASKSKGGLQQTVVHRVNRRFIISSMNIHQNCMP